ncbi:MAG: CRTAC1 family protein [Candidatus Auribacterota bacterium]|nr:CRTAC1 family protein [Candidatus Auribacterota bacterium]
MREGYKLISVGRVLFFIFCLVLLMFGAFSPVSDAETVSAKESRKDGDPGTQSGGFIDVSQQAGIKRETMTYGPAWCDFDNDGDLDIYVGNHENYPSLYQNDGSGHFTDIFLYSGLDRTEAIDRHGAAWGDFNNDGRPDLYISIGGERGLGIGYNELYQNLGKGKFKNISVEAGVTDTRGRGRDPVWCDIDRDRNLDLYVGNFDTPNLLFKGLGNSQFVEKSVKTNLTAGPQYLVSPADFDRDGDLDFYLGGRKDRLYLNQGKAGFKDVSEERGIKQAWGIQAAAWGDYNNDGYPDLYISRGRTVDAWNWDGPQIEFTAMVTPIKDLDGLDFRVPGETFVLNLRLDWDENLQFIYLGKDKVPPSRMPFTIDTNSKIADGKPDFKEGTGKGFFIWKDPGTDCWHIRWTGDFLATHDFVGIIKSDRSFMDVKPVSFDQPLPPPSTLYKNSGEGYFTDVTGESGLTVRENFQTAIWGDYDNDGDLDLYLVNRGDGLYNGANYLFQNQGDGTFVDVAEAVGVEADVGGRGRGAAWGDYNDDGFLDLFVTNGWGAPLFFSGPHILFKNQGNDNNWLKIKLVGTTSNRFGLQCQVTLKTGDSIQYREMGSETESCSQSCQPLHFGLGKAKKIDSITVDWPSGKRNILRNLPVNRTLEIVE